MTRSEVIGCLLALKMSKVIDSETREAVKQAIDMLAATGTARYGMPTIAEIDGVLSSPTWLDEKITGKVLLRRVRDILADATPATGTAEGWQPIELELLPAKAIPARAAWFYGRHIGVQLGSFGRFSDGVAFGDVPSFNGCIVRDWQATHMRWADIPAPPASTTETPKMSTRKPSTPTRKTKQSYRAYRVEGQRNCAMLFDRMSRLVAEIYDPELSQRICKLLNAAETSK